MDTLQMNASAAPKMSESQSAAMGVFVKRCEYAMLTVVFVCFGAIALVVAANPLSPDIWPILVALWAVIGLYPLVLLAVIWLRTGLKWHLLNAHALWLGVSGALIISTLAFVEVLLPLLQGTPTGSFGTGSVAALLIVAAFFFAPAFRSSTRTRADRERAHFADRWLKLGSLPFWRIFVLVIPHERA
jgi:hypothetical protein